MVRVASLFSMTFTNSSLEMFLLPSVSSTSSKILCSFIRAYCTARSSRSAAATALTTSHRTPISMFITVSVAMRRKKSRASIRKTLSCCRAVDSSLTSSKSAPLIHSVCMPSSTEPKCCFPTSVPLQSCWKPMENMYTTTANSKSIRPTQRMADTIPFTRIMSSGIARSSRAMRAMRVKRNNRKTRRTDVLPNPTLFAASASLFINRTTVMTQVSDTMRITKAKSKQNHLSLRQSRFLPKAMNRMNSSPKKYAQKRFSTTWKKGCALMSTSEVL
mmetsp:Transcript_66631/g.206030  ORF Transcript_66631/g.206030 Transcript_66631/m.206030 type:complete len:274 (+) Transcript_66631:450-1271(+)